MNIIVKGKVWKFGDNISSDYMAPGFAFDEPWEKRKKFVLHINKAFTEGFQTGDVIVAGNNFGCGSTREAAPANLKQLGVGCVVAESFARTFFRNCMSIGLPILSAKGVSDIFQEEDMLELDFDNAHVKNLTSGKEIKGPPLAPDLISIVKKGGIMNLLKSEKKGL